MLRKAVIACMAAVTGISTTVATGAMSSGVIAFVLCSQAQGETYTITESDDANLYTIKSPDYIIFDLEGKLAIDTPTSTKILANVQIDKLNITSGTNGHTYVFNQIVYGSGNFNVIGVDSLEFQFLGDMSEYSGNMIIADDKIGTFWFKNNCKTGTGSITALNVDSLVKIGTTTVYNSSISAGNVNIIGNAIFKNDITLNAITSITNSGNTSFEGVVTLGHSIENSNKLTFYKDIKLAKGFGFSTITPEENGFAKEAYQIITGEGTIELKDGVKILNSAGRALYTQTGDTQVFTGTLSESTGTVYYLVEEGTTVSASAISNETGYYITANKGVLELEESIVTSSVKDGITVDVGEGNSAEIILKKGATFSDISKIETKSGTLNFTLDSGAEYTLTKVGHINGTFTVKDGATLKFNGDTYLEHINTLALKGEENSWAKIVLTGNASIYNSLELKGNTQISEKTLKFASSYQKVTASGTNNTIASNISGDKALTFYVANAGELKITGNVNHTATGSDIFYKMDTGTLVLAGKENNIAGQVCVYGGELKLSANANLTGGAAVGDGCKLTVDKGTAALISELKFDKGGAFEVLSGATANVGALVGKGAITVADDGTLLLTKVNITDSITITGTATTGLGFSKTGTGTLTLDCLKIDGQFNMNGHAGLDAKSYAFGDAVTLVYGSGEVLNIGAISTAITLDVSKEEVVEAMQTDTGVDTGITLGTSQSLDSFRKLLTVQGITNYELKEQDGRVWIKAGVVLSDAWDANWGIAGLATAPKASDLTKRTIDQAVVSLKFAPVELTGGGSADTIVAGGIVRESEAAAGLQTGHSWIMVTGGDYFAVVGGNVNMGTKDAGAASFKGDTHVQTHGGTMDYIVGGNMRDYAKPTFEGNTYVSVYQGTTVNKSVIGGSTIFYGQPVVLDGSTHVFVYTVLNDADDKKGFVVGGNFHESVTGAVSGITLSVTGSTNVTVDLSEYKMGGDAATEFTKNIVGGHYVVYGGCTSSVGGKSHVSINGLQDITFSGDIVGGTWMESQAPSSIADTKLEISGGGIYNGRVVAGNLHNGTAGASTVSGCSELIIDGGTFNSYVVGGSSLASVEKSQYGDASVNSVKLTIKSGNFEGSVVGGTLVASADGSNAYSASSASVGSVTMNLNSANTAINNLCGGYWVDKRSFTTGATLGNVTINVDGATITNIYGGSYLNTDNGTCALTQKGIIINLNSGKLAGDLYAAGVVAAAGTMSTDSTIVNVGKDFDFSAVKTLSGGYKLGGTGTAAITGDSTLSFAADTTYANTTNLNAVDFSCIEVGEGTEASIATIKNAAGSLTKSGAGTLNIDSTMAMDTILLQGGALNVKKGITSSKGLAVHATSSGASMKVNEDLTLAALHVDMLKLEAGRPVLDIEGKLSGFGTDNVLKVVLNDYEKLENGSYVLAEMESIANNLQLQYDAFATAPDGMIYELVLSGKSLVFNYRTLSNWVWEGTADGNEKVVWSDTSHDGWKADSETPSGQNVYFTAAGASEENGDGNVMISGTVEPGNIEMLGGEYTFSAASDGGDIQLTDGTLNIGSGAKLTMAMANANLGGTTVLGGELVLKSADAIGNSVLKFNGGTLVYEEGITTDLSAQAGLAGGYTGPVKIEVKNNEKPVTWGDVDSAKNNSGVQAALTNGFEKTGAGHFILQVARPDSAVAYTGDLLVKEGKLTVKGTESITIAEDADITVDTELMVDSASQKSGSVAVDVAGNLTGEGTLSFGASTAADYRISGDNTQFKGKIQLADTEGKTLFADDMAMGGSDTTVHLNGATFSVEDGTQAVRAQLLVTETSVLAAEDDITFSAAPTGTGTLAMTGDHTATFSGAVDTFEGTFSTAEEATIALGGKDAAALNGNITVTLAGAGTYCMDYKNSVVLSGVVRGTANLHQSGSGKLILIAEKNTTTGTLTVDEGTKVQLGNAATPGTWAGTELAGKGTFILTYGTLSGLTTKAEGAKLAVKTTKRAVSTYARRSGADEGTIVSLSGAAAQLLDSIELAEGSTLHVGNDPSTGKPVTLIVGGTSKTKLDMALTARNFGKDLGNTIAMIQGCHLTIAGTEGVSLKLNKADLLTALGDIGKGDLYLQITDGALYTAKGLNINDVIAPDLLGMGIRAHLTDVSKAGGYVIINGDVSGVFYTNKQPGNGEFIYENVDVKNGVLGIHAVTVVNTDDTLTIHSNTNVNNLNGQAGGDVVITDKAKVILNNKSYEKPEAVEVKNTLEGSLTGQTDTSITVKGEGGSLTVGGKLTADTLIVESGDLIANGSANVKNLTVAKFATMTVANGMELKAGSIQGVLKADGAGTSLKTTGQVSVGGTLSNMDLTIESGSMEFLNDEERKGTAALNSLQVKESATLEGNGTTVCVGASQPNIIAGTLSGSGSLEMTGSTESKLIFDNATGSTGWSVTTQGDIEIDSTEGKALRLGQVSLGSPKTLTLRFNSDKHQDNNFNVFDLLNLDFSTAEDGTTTAITLISTGSAQLEDGRYVLGTIENGISFGGLSFQATEVELTQLPLQLVGDAFSRIDVEQSTLVFADKALILNLVKSDANAFEMPNAEKNAATGAELLWRAVTPEDGDLKDVYNAVNYMIADGDNQAAQEAMAAVAGSSTASLGMALAGDVERQLRAIRNRTTTMGVNQCVMNENMPYFNAWVNAEGNHSELDQDGLASGYVLDSWGGTVGFDVDVNPNLTFGLAVTAMYGDLTVDGPDTLEGDMDTCYVTAFARYSKHAWTHTLIGTIGKMDGSYERTVNYGRNSYTAEGDTDGTTFGLMYEVSRTYAFSEDSDACWQPVFNIAYRHTTVKGYTETATDAALDVDDQTLDTVTLSAGARMQAVVGENLFERTSVLELRALAKLDVGDRASEADVALINGTGRGTVESAELGAFGVELGAGLSIPVGNVNDGTIFFDVSAELRSGYSNVNGTVGYRINF